MEIKQYSIEEIKDPTNIIEGKRYEVLLDVEVDEEDELFSEAGIEVRVLVGQNDEDIRIMNYHLIDKQDQKYLDFALDEDEEEMIATFCREELLRDE
nr:DUF6509 family protein [Lysinibacillus timonensis]